MNKEQITFEALFAQRCKNLSFLIREMRTALNLPEVTFSDITTTNLRRVADHLLTTRTNNSVRTYMAHVKAFLNELATDGYIPNANVVKTVRVKSEPQENVFLTPSEVESIWQYYTQLASKDNGDITKGILTLFLIECYTGARSIDCERFTVSNIENGVLSYVSQKTRTLTRVPAHYRLPVLFANMPRRQYNRMTKGNVIKRVCKECGITQPVTIFYHGKEQTRPKYEYVSTHTGRRSFVCALVDKNVPIASVSKMCGHASITQTQRYYVNKEFQLDQQAMSFFNG